MRPASSSIIAAWPVIMFPSSPIALRPKSSSSVTGSTIIAEKTPMAISFNFEVGFLAQHFICGGYKWVY